MLRCEHFSLYARSHRARADGSRSYYKALSFYLQEQPKLLNDLLAVLTPRIDHTRVVRMFQRTNNVILIKPYLISIQNVGSLLDIVMAFD